MRIIIGILIVVLMILGAVIWRINNRPTAITPVEEPAKLAEPKTEPKVNLKVEPKIVPKEPVRWVPQIKYGHVIKR